MSNWALLLITVTPVLVLAVAVWGAEVWRGRRREPRHGRGRQQDRATFNRAVVAYVWGEPRQGEPGDHRDAVPDELFELVALYLELAYRLPDWSRHTPA